MGGQRRALAKYAHLSKRQPEGPSGTERDHLGDDRSQARCIGALFRQPFSQHADQVCIEFRDIVRGVAILRLRGVSLQGGSQVERARSASAAWCLSDNRCEGR